MCLKAHMVHMVYVNSLCQMHVQMMRFGTTNRIPNSSNTEIFVPDHLHIDTLVLITYNTRVYTVD